jgi:NitT/TauT family transport system substrate-binding protein/putative hydroxymethylpyrimidine transport system substrate-binding protein
MRWVAAPLAAVLCALAGCGGGAEPGAPEGATLVLDFTPNAVHTGIYVAKQRGYFEDEGVDLIIREPSSSSDAPKLLEAGRADFAILDINDLGIALERGFDLVPIAGLVDRPLGSVIASAEIARPRELEGRDVGVTGLPSDDAVLDTVVSSDGGDPARVNRVNIGFNAVGALSGGKVDAATAFWNAEGVALSEQGVPTREFRVDRYGAPRFPELVLVTSLDRYREQGREFVDSVVNAIRRGYIATRQDPGAALDDLLSEVPELDRAETEAELEAVLPAFPTDGPLRDRALYRAIAAWGDWATRHGIVAENPSPSAISIPADG